MENTEGEEKKKEEHERKEKKKSSDEGERVHERREISHGVSGVG